MGELRCKGRAAVCKGVGEPKQFINSTILELIKQRERDDKRMGREREKAYLKKQEITRMFQQEESEKEEIRGRRRKQEEEEKKNEEEKEEEERENEEQRRGRGGRTIIVKVSTSVNDLDHVKRNTRPHGREMEGSRPPAQRTRAASPSPLLRERSYYIGHSGDVVSKPQLTEREREMHSGSCD
ncbi:hypothetical protein Hamer_G008841 [Homarus americanus]|uniref:Uncharacterized protein n=1 Tax=Homarus americanus TaxID=6706 RepID=A0A8J5JJ60_HOMAM|nr:hypothetical protein Hamer_G008841 [Homarus americanus]